MERGDIIAYYPNANGPWLSRAISWLQPRIGQGGFKDKPSASHIAIVSEIEGFLYESTWPKSRFHEIEQDDFKSFDVCIYRYDGITQSERDLIIEYCSQNLGVQYDIFELITLGLFNFKRWKACSEFARYAYGKAGIQLGQTGENLLSPNELIYETSRLKFVERLTK